ncbi:hypothetical protein NLJ89_g11441 [Agrocybe chaxingu]|uniref:Uncharacterized protein n=1 Tax=Agrocybe chaxingu TaxID=84603 RepID=A0A9W8MPD2_9AGAR|nr:hypothetical protein NLJ89_g11441 [Agrocybe chaxingu]
MHLQPAFASAVADVLLGAHDVPTARLLDRRGAPTMAAHRMPGNLPPALIALLDSSTSRRRTCPYFPHPSHLKKLTFQDTHDNHDAVGTVATSFLRTTSLQQHAFDSIGCSEWKPRTRHTADDDNDERDTQEW